VRQELAQRRIKAVIPPNPTRRHPHRYNKNAYKGRNVIERMFCRLKDFRRIATRYDKRADIYLSTILWRQLLLGGSIERTLEQRGEYDSVGPRSDTAAARSPTRHAQRRRDLHHQVAQSRTANAGMADSDAGAALSG
jgi:putative transposase